MDQTNLDIYGHPPIPWSRAEKQLATPSDANTNPFPFDGPARWTAAVAGVGALWVDGKSTSSAGRTRKSRNLAERADCVISVKLADLDLVVEGVAAKVTDDATLQRLAKLYDAQGWPATVENRAFTAPYSAPSAGPPPWDLYEFTPRTAFGVATAEPYGAMRWHFQTCA